MRRRPTQIVAGHGFVETAARALRAFKATDEGQDGCRIYTVDLPNSVALESERDHSYRTRHTTVKVVNEPWKCRDCTARSPLWDVRRPTLG